LKCADFKKKKKKGVSTEPYGTVGQTRLKFIRFSSFLLQDALLDTVEVAQPPGEYSSSQWPNLSFCHSPPRLPSNIPEPFTASSITGLSQAAWRHPSQYQSLLRALCQDRREQRC